MKQEEEERLNRINYNVNEMLQISNEVNEELNTQTEKIKYSNKTCKEIEDELEHSHSLLNKFETVLFGLIPFNLRNRFKNRRFKKRNNVKLSKNSSDLVAVDDVEDIEVDNNNLNNSNGNSKQLNNISFQLNKLKQNTQTTNNLIKQQREELTNLEQNVNQVTQRIQFQNKRIKKIK